MPTTDELELQKLEAEVRREIAEADKAELEMKLIKAQGAASGEFVFVGTVEEKNVHTMIDKLDTWSRMHPGQPIKLLINSDGGSIYDGNAFYDFLRILSNRGHHVTTLGTGMVASMASLILQAGDERRVTPKTWLLLHEVQFITHDAQQFSASTLDDRDKQIKRLQAQALDILCEKAKWSRKKLQTFSKRKDAFMSAQEALDAGLIDAIEEL